MNQKTVSLPDVRQVTGGLKPSRGLLFGLLLLAALLAFEIFNYSTTDYALTDLLGDLRFMGMQWATILAIAFCGIDFAGIARLFTPEKGSSEHKEVWYLFGAWLLAATMNAMLTWWGVAIAMLNHDSLGTSVISPTTLVKVVPIFVAIMVWLIRVLIIGSFSVAGDRMFSLVEPAHTVRPQMRSSQRETLSPTAALTSQSAAYQPQPNADPSAASIRTEPTYHPVSMSSASPNPVRK